MLSCQAPLQARWGANADSRAALLKWLRVAPLSNTLREFRLHLLQDGLAVRARLLWLEADCRRCAAVPESAKQLLLACDHRI